MEELSLHTAVPKCRQPASEMFTAASVVVDLSDVKFYYLRMQNYNKVQIRVNQLTCRS